MESLGSELKQAREAAGISLGDMATRTKISVVALEALERDDFSRLPGGIFGRSFVRAYALEVGVDPDTTVTRFVALLEASEREAAERRAAMRAEITQDDRQFLERQRRAMLILRVAVVVLLMAVIGVVVWRVRVAQTAADVESPILQTTPVIVPPEPADPIPVVTPEAADVRSAAVMIIELDVSADCWISMSVDGGAAVARLFRAGDHQRLEVTREILLDVGNAGGLTLVIDGKPARPLGREGVHVRTRITRQNVGEFLQ